MADDFQIKLERFNVLINEFAEILSKEEKQKNEPEITVDKPTDFTSTGSLDEQLINIYNENTHLKRRIKLLESEVEKLKNNAVASSH